MILLIDMLHMLMILLCPDQIYQQVSITTFQELIYKTQQFMVGLQKCEFSFYRGAGHRVEVVMLYE